MRDYALNKLFWDLQQDPALAAAYRQERLPVLDRYPLAPEVRAALLADDVAPLAPLVNPYLLRFYFTISGMPDAEFVRRIRASAPPAAEVRHR